MQKLKNNQENDQNRENNQLLDAYYQKDFSLYLLSNLKNYGVKVETTFKPGHEALKDVAFSPGIYQFFKKRNFFNLNRDFAKEKLDLPVGYIRKNVENLKGFENNEFSSGFGTPWSRKRSSDVQNLLPNDKKLVNQAQNSFCSMHIQLPMIEINEELSNSDSTSFRTRIPRSNNVSPKSTKHGLNSNINELLTSKPTETPFFSTPIKVNNPKHLKWRNFSTEKGKNKTEEIDIKRKIHLKKVSKKTKSEITKNNQSFIFNMNITKPRNFRINSLLQSNRENNDKLVNDKHSWKIFDNLILNKVLDNVKDTSKNLNKSLVNNDCKYKNKINVAEMSVLKLSCS